MLLAFAAHAQQGQLTLGGGLHYSSGDYGTGSTTRITMLSATGSYETGPWLYKATVPYLEVSGDRSVIPGTGRVRGGTAPTRTESGLGDIVVSVKDLRQCQDRCPESGTVNLAYGAGKILEWTYTAESVVELARSVGVEMPISEQVFHVLHRGRPLQEAVQLLVNLSPATAAARTYHRAPDRSCCSGTVNSSCVR